MWRAESFLAKKKGQKPNLVKTKFKLNRPAYLDSGFGLAELSNAGTSDLIECGIIAIFQDNGNLKASSRRFRQA
jgi:hypothetical protein